MLRKLPVILIYLVIAGCTPASVAATMTPTPINTLAPSTSSPSDLLAHLNYPPGATGLGFEAEVDQSDVLPEHSIRVTSNYGYLSPYGMQVDFDHPQIAVGSDLLIQAENYEPGERVSTEFIAPDGTTGIQQATVDEEGFWNTTWLLRPHSPLGTYTFKFISHSGTESIRFEVVQPEASFIHAVCGEGNQLDVYLLGFKPGEVVQLAFYSGEDRALQASWSVTAGSDGSASTTSPNSDQRFGIMIALGDERPFDVEDSTSGGAMQITAMDLISCG